MAEPIKRPIDLQRAVDEGLLIERLFVVRADDMEENEDRTIPVVFSTEHEYRNWFGREILSHDPGACDMERMGNKTAPVMLNHNRSEQIGVVEGASVVDRQGKATLRFSRSTLGEEIYRDILEGIRSQVSAGYKIRKWEVDKTDPNDPLYTILEWTPFEISVVTLNADPKAIVQRAGYFYPVDDESDRLPAGEPTKREDKEMAEPKVTAAVPTAQSFEIYERGKAEEEQNLAMEIINKGGNLEDFEKELKAKRDLLSKEKAPDPVAEREERDANRFRVSDLIFQMLNPGAERGQQALIEAKDLTSDAEKKGFVRYGANSVILPFSRLDGMDDSKHKLAQRDLTSLDASGGHLIGDDVRGDIFVWALRNKMVLGDMVTMLTGLRGDVSIPAETTEPTAAWVAENAAPTESNPVIGQIPLTPHHARGFVEISNTLISQSSVDVEMVIRESLVKAIALIVDKAILTGTGSSNQPSGIDSIASLSTTSYSTSIANATLGDIIAVETALDTANAPDMNRAWICAPNVRAKYRTVPIGTGGVPSWYMGMLLDSPAHVTNQAPAGEAYYASWKECFCALWDAISVQVNPFSLDTQGLTRVVASQFVDVGFAHGGSFAKLEMA